MVVVGKQGRLWLFRSQSSCGNNGRHIVSRRSGPLVSLHPPSFCRATPPPLPYSNPPPSSLFHSAPAHIFPAQIYQEQENTHIILTFTRRHTTTAPIPRILAGPRVAVSRHRQSPSTGPRPAIKVRNLSPASHPRSPIDNEWSLSPTAISGKGCIFISFIFWRWARAGQATLVYPVRRFGYGRDRS